MDLMVEEKPTVAVSGGQEDAILLRELSHRAGNDCAIALAALRVIGSGRLANADERSRLIGQATARLETSAQLHRLLAQPVAARVEAGAWLAAVSAAAASAGLRSGQGVELNVQELWLDGAVARRLVMIAAELVTNAVKYAVVEGVESLAVTAHAVAGCVWLRVADRGPGIAPGPHPKGGGLGSGIVADLVALGCGRLSIETGPAGTTVLVEMPTSPTAAPDRRITGIG